MEMAFIYYLPNLVNSSATCCGLPVMVMENGLLVFLPSSCELLMGISIGPESNGLPKYGSFVLALLLRCFATEDLLCDDLCRLFTLG
jgi:hypothetical protein